MGKSVKIREGPDGGLRFYAGQYRRENKQFAEAWFGWQLARLEPGEALDASMVLSGPEKTSRRKDEANGQRRS